MIVGWGSNDTIEIATAIIGVLLTILIPLAAFIYRRKRKLSIHYKVTWKKSSELKPDEVLGIRGEEKFGFHGYYLQRHTDEVIREKILNNQSVLVVGNPLAGKSRAIYRALLTLSKPHDVIIPKLVDISLIDFQIPFHLQFWRKKVLVLDDIEKFAEKQNSLHLFRTFLQKGTIIVATCRSGPEYNKLCKKMERELSSIFGNPIEISKISVDEGGKVAAQTGRQLPDSFDGNIGSIFLQLDTMRERFRGCIEIEKGILRSLKRLYYAGIYREREIFSVDRIKHTCMKTEEIEKKHYEWLGLLRELKNKGFIELMKNEVRAEETYLEFVVEDDFSALENLNEMIETFANDSDALLGISNQAYHSGLVDIQKAEYMKAAIKAYKEALKFHTIQESPTKYAIVQNNLGSAFTTLAEVRDTAKNCEKAIKAYKEALKFHTIQESPTKYAIVQNNLGSAFTILAEVRDTAKNCEKAIKAYKEVQKVHTKEESPKKYYEIERYLKKILSLSN